ncbi:hypothetical protein [Limosilactobacillus sp.]|uniref:hypothetical protein n=1 Tax=Limosilactobacillus sp. TaxID=2773925 RepID=UPI00345E6715
MRYDLDYYSVDHMRHQLEHLSEKHDSIKSNISERQIKEVFDLFNKHYHDRITEIDKLMKDQVFGDMDLTYIRQESRFINYVYKANSTYLKNTKRRVEEIYDYELLNITGDFVESYDDMADQIIDETFKQLNNMTDAIDNAYKVIMNKEKIDLELLPEI